jgi:hypothetical protein
MNIDVAHMQHLSFISYRPVHRRGDPSPTALFAPKELDLIFAI